VAAGAVRPEAALVGIILLVTGNTLHRRPYKGQICVASAAHHGQVRAHQFEIRIVVVEIGRLPGYGRMAGGAIGPQFAPMRIVGRVAGKASLRGEL